MEMGREEDMEELSLELSIGGKYGKAENLKEKTTEYSSCGGNADCEERSDFVATRCDFSGVEAFDPQRRREIQALRRQEARRKREEKVKKSRGVNAVGFVEDKLFLEVQRIQARARDREIRERNCFCENRGNWKNCCEEVADGLGLSSVSEKKQKDEWLYPKVQFASPLVECDSDYSNGVKSLEQCSSAVSDYRSISHKGESSSDTGSHSSHLRPPRLDQIESHDSSSQAETAAKLAPNPISKPQPTWMRSNADSSPSPDAANVSSTSSKETSGGLNGNRPCLPRMPCVSTTGNGPNGRTVSGFLYRYNKTEVSILCICHGRSFSPAEFVEHAGGVDVTHPLRHITVVPFGPAVAR